MEIAIALDVCVGKKRTERLKTLGYKVVCIARDAETDASWVNRAFSAGAFFVISADMDIPKIVEREGYPMCWVEYPSDVRDGRDLVSYIDKAMKMKLQMFADLFGVEKQFVGRDL